MKNNYNKLITHNFLGLGLPIYINMRLKSYNKRKKLDEKLILFNYGYYYLGYKARFYYWEML